MHIHLGDISISQDIDSFINKEPHFLTFVRESLKSHLAGDWGNIPILAREANIRAQKKQTGVIFSSHFDGLFKKKLWIITEPEKNVTQILLKN